MYCLKCNKHLSECTCGDIEERLDSLNDVLVYKKCKLCGKHYSQCQYDTPEWESSNPDFPLPEEAADEY